MANRTCTIEGCERKLIARGLCGMHYARWSKTGSVGTAEQIRPWRELDRWCSVEGCTNEFYGRGLCSTHYARWRKHGDPSIVLPVFCFQPGNTYGPRERRLQEVVGYEGAHRRVTRIHGSALKQICKNCGRPARDWCYDHADPNEVISDGDRPGLRYSLIPEHYVPLCRSCHRLFDKGKLVL